MAPIRAPSIRRRRLNMKNRWEHVLDITDSVITNKNNTGKVLTVPRYADILKNGIYYRDFRMHTCDLSIQSYGRSVPVLYEKCFRGEKKRKLAFAVEYGTSGGLMTKDYHLTVVPEGTMAGEAMALICLSNLGGRQYLEPHGVLSYCTSPYARFKALMGIYPRIAVTAEPLEDNVDTELYLRELARSSVATRVFHILYDEHTNPRTLEQVGGIPGCSYTKEEETGVIITELPLMPSELQAPTLWDLRRKGAEKPLVLEETQPVELGEEDNVDAEWYR